MSQPGRPGATGRTPEPLRVASQRLTEDEASASASAEAPAPAPAPDPAPDPGPAPAASSPVSSPASEAPRSPSGPSPAGPSHAASSRGVGTATVDPTGPLPAVGRAPDVSGPAAPAAPVLAREYLPVVAPRPRRRFSDLWRLVFSRRRAGRHRPETTPPHSWSMFAPQQRRRSRRWGRL